MYKSSFTYSMSASRHKSRPRSKSVAARLPPSERTVSPSSARRSTLSAVAAASANVVDLDEVNAENAAAAAEFPPKDYKEDVMKFAKEGFMKWLKFMPPVEKKRQQEWDLIELLSRCDALYDSLDPTIRLIPSRPQNLVQRKKTLACNIAWSIAPYIDVNGKAQRAEFNRLFGASRNGPTRLTDQYVPESVKKHVQKMKKKAGDAEDEEMKE